MKTERLSDYRDKAVTDTRVSSNETPWLSLTYCTSILAPKMNTKVNANMRPWLAVV